MNNKRFYRTFILFKNIHILQIQFNTHTNRAEKFEMSIIIKVHTVSIKIFRLLPRALMSPVFDTTLFHFVQFFIYLLFLSIICCLLHISWCWSYYVGSNHNSGNSHAPNVFCKLDDLWCSVWCRNIAGRCHSLQSVEIPCLTLVQSSLQHEDQSVSMNGLVFRLRHAA